MRLSKFALGAIALLTLAFAVPALAGNTTLFSSTLGDITFPFTAPASSGAAGTIDNMTIGATTPRAGHFTTISGTGAISGAVSATTLSASGAVALSPASANVVISPTGSGLVTINPATAGTVNNVVIGGTTPLAGTFTALSATSQKFTGTAPTPTGTGSPTIASGSTDTAGEVTAGSTATSVVITFATAKSNAPFCVVTSQTQLAAFAYTISTTAITITQTATSGNLIDYNCVQH